MNKAIFGIFKVGIHKGVEWSEERVNRIASLFNKKIKSAPLVINHPQDDKPQYGEVERLFLKNGVLFAECTIDDTLKRLIQNGQINGISSAFYLPHNEINPFNGVADYLRHVGFLVGQNPAVKGLPDPKQSLLYSNNCFLFSDQEFDCVLFSEDRCKTESEQVHKKITAYSKITGMTYQETFNYLTR